MTTVSNAVLLAVLFGPLVAIDGHLVNIGFVTIMLIDGKTFAGKVRRVQEHRNVDLALTVTLRAFLEVGLLAYDDWR